MEEMGFEPELFPLKTLRFLLQCCSCLVILFLVYSQVINKVLCCSISKTKTTAVLPAEFHFLQNGRIISLTLMIVQISSIKQHWKNVRFYFLESI